jgi:hypothetical protein
MRGGRGGGGGVIAGAADAVGGCGCGVHRPPAHPPANSGLALPPCTCLQVGHVCWRCHQLVRLMVRRRLRHRGGHVPGRRQADPMQAAMPPAPRGREATPALGDARLAPTHEQGHRSGLHAGVREGAAAVGAGVADEITLGGTDPGGQLCWAALTHTQVAALVSRESRLRPRQLDSDLSQSSCVSARQLPRRRPCAPGNVMTCRSCSLG